MKELAQYNNLLSTKLSSLGKKTYWGGLSNSSVALAICELVSNHKKSVLMIAKDLQQAKDWYKDIIFFTEKTSYDIFLFPDWEILPYEKLPPSQKIASDRIKMLSNIIDFKKGIIILTIESLMQYLPPKTHIQKHRFFLSQGQKIDLMDFTNYLISIGYSRVKQILQMGEFVLRGSSFDIQPFGNKKNFRIDLFDDEIESITIIDSKKEAITTNNIYILPTQEIDFSKEGVANFKNNYQNYFKDKNVWFYKTVINGDIPIGVTYFMPLFFTKVNNFFDYLSNELIIFCADGLYDMANKYWQYINDIFKKKQDDTELSPLPPDSVFINPQLLFTRLKTYKQIIFSDKTYSKKTAFNFGITKLADNFYLDNKEKYEYLSQYIKNTENRVLLAVSSLGRKNLVCDKLYVTKKIEDAESWLDFLYSNKKLAIIVSTINYSMQIKNIVIVAEDILFDVGLIKQKKQRQSNKHIDFIEPLSALDSLEIDDPIVHEQHGVGRYLGLKIHTYDNQQKEYLEIQYANNAILSVPITSLYLVSRYSSATAIKAPVHTLGSKKWLNIKEKTQKTIEDMAHKLLGLYAKRQLAKSFSFKPPDNSYQEFVDKFTFKETKDQSLAIEQVIKDMVSDKKMDRLICGDVGFGKTEVALRACFLAVQSKTQVVILVPTTVLCQQHYNVFSERFSDYPIFIEMLSRFQTPSEQIKIIKKLKNNKIDIIIGTHRLLQKDIEFHNLRLIIIDEEHRFGVKDKEKLRHKKVNCDTITMTATPIPRTLSLALESFKDISIIATAPSHRQPIKTIVSQWDKDLIYEACFREIHRGGQVFFLHNNIKTIYAEAETLEKILPQASIRVAHGQMSKNELEVVMKNFYSGQFQILVCTTIIEIGIDIPAANTIIVNRAENYGLAQLHQLRGRVGRSSRLAYAYLIVSSNHYMRGVAGRRIKTIESLQELGSGFLLANYDLEIRGAGEFLGLEQSGKMYEIGFYLYKKLLDKAVDNIKNNTEGSNYLEHNLEIDLGVKCFIPKNYIQDVQKRLYWYQKISQNNSKNEQIELKVEMIDSFGQLPQSVINLFALSELRIFAVNVGVKSIKVRQIGLDIIFYNADKLNMLQLVTCIQKNPDIYKLNKDKWQLIFNKKFTTDINIIAEIFNFLKKISIK